MKRLFLALVLCSSFVAADRLEAGQPYLILRPLPTSGFRGTAYSVPMHHPQPYAYGYFGARSYHGAYWQESYYGDYHQKTIWQSW